MSQSGRFIATKMVELSMQHFQLSCTTVTGIPMKVGLCHCHTKTNKFISGTKPIYMQVYIIYA